MANEHNWSSMGFQRDRYGTRAPQSTDQGDYMLVYDNVLIYTAFPKVEHTAQGCKDNRV
jgi:hypothetical protein